MPEESTDNPEEMSEESTDSPEEQKRRVRRKLLKLGTYTGIAMISSFVASKTAYAVCAPQKPCSPKPGTGQLS
jgi:hypothetical protein